MRCHTWFLRFLEVEKSFTRLHIDCYMVAHMILQRSHQGCTYSFTGLQIVEKSFTRLHIWFHKGGTYDFTYGFGHAWLKNFHVSRGLIWFHKGFTGFHKVARGCTFDVLWFAHSC